jgi:hypothetical protein
LVQFAPVISKKFNSDPVDAIFAPRIKMVRYIRLRTPAKLKPPPQTPEKRFWFTHRTRPGRPLKTGFPGHFQGSICLTRKCNQNSPR